MDTNELLTSILADYNSYYHDNDLETTSQERTQSFIYNYFLNEKSRELAKFTERETDFYKGLAALVKGVKLNCSADLLKLSGKDVSVRDNYLLLALSRKAFENGWISGDELKAVIMKARRVKKAPPVLFQRESDGYEAAWERSLRILLQKTICDFFNSKGFLVNDSGSTAPEAKTQLRSKAHAADRKERDLVQLYSEYCEYLNEHSVQPVGKPAGRKPKSDVASIADYKDRGQRLLRAITDDKRNSGRYKGDIIPLYFDPRIGAGVYLIGADCFEPAALDTADINRESVCIPCIVSFFSVNSNNLGQFVYAEDMENRFAPLKAGFDMDVELFDTVNEAFEALEQQLGTFDFHEKYSILNQGICPTLDDKDFRHIME